MIPLSKSWRQGKGKMISIENVDNNNNHNNLSSLFNECLCRRAGKSRVAGAFSSRDMNGTNELSHILIYSCSFYHSFFFSSFIIILFHFFFHFSYIHSWFKPPCSISPSIHTNNLILHPKFFYNKFTFFFSFCICRRCTDNSFELLFFIYTIFSSNIIYLFICE